MAGGFGVYDLEREIYGSSSPNSRTLRQRKIRRVLRGLGKGVGSGNRYSWPETQLRSLTVRVRQEMTGRASTKPTEKPVVRVRPFQYRPSKAELEADVTVDASPEEIRDALMRSIMVEEADDA